MRVNSAFAIVSDRILAIGLLAIGLGIRLLSFLGQSKRLQMRGLLPRGNSLRLIFGHFLSRIPRVLFLSETLFCSLSGLIGCHESFSWASNVAITLRPLWC